jgi:iron(III) transport system ATP-binding protein
MPELIVEEIHKQLGGTAVLKGVSFSLDRGEVMALLGHSGSGKTTLLRAIAGLEVPDRGRIALRDRVVFDAASDVEVPPERRGLGLVFQSYALWPHRTVFDNVAYGLRVRGLKAGELRARVQEVLERLGLEAMAQRHPHQLSGGQQQRVALARALVYRPPVLLLDEPLSNLDAKLREDARTWLRALIRQVQISALYVTHDQVEALAVADRILFLRDGRIEQAGTPQDIYERPATALAADFMGSNNRLSGTLGALADGRGRLDGAGFSLWGVLSAPHAVGDALTGFVRVERTRLGDGAGANRLPMQLDSCIYLGERWEYLLTCGDLRARCWGPTALPAGPRWVEFPADHVWLF